MNKMIFLLALLPFFTTPLIGASHNKPATEYQQSLVDNVNEHALESEIVQHSDCLQENGKIIFTNLAQIITHIINIVANPKNFSTIAPNIGNIINNIINIAVTLFKKQLPNITEEELEAVCQETFSEDIKKEITRLCIKRFQQYP